VIIYGGKIYDSDWQDRLLSEIEQRINGTLGKKLDVDKVIAAIDALGKEIAAGKYDDVFDKLPIDDPLRYKALAVAMLSRENVLFKMQTELGGVPQDYVTEPPKGLPKIRVITAPLGVIFHVAAGNADGLPAYSLVEGLLCGNVNILKLPQADNGLALKIIFRLIELEPTLADYIYVFDTPSTDVIAMQKMASFADGICVWGGDAAVGAVRKLAPSGAKLIEWGHKLSFCYLSESWRNRHEQLCGLAEHVAATKQLLCSSCQTIFIDTDSETELHEFCKTFLPMLQDAVSRRQSNAIGERAYFTLIRQTALLDEIVGGKTSNANEYSGAGCRLIVCQDSKLEISPMMCSVPVKRLPKEKILETLRAQKGYLQTVGLICADDECERLTEILCACGVTKICDPRDMSEFFSGEAHDGEYPMRRYTRIVNVV